MRTFTPEGEITYPLQYGDSLVLRLLRSGETYLVTDATAARMAHLLRNGHIRGVIGDVPERPCGPEAQSLLVFWSGEAGDILAAWPALVPSEIDPIGVVLATDEAELVPEGVAAYRYPMPLRLAEGYEAWVQFDARAQLDVPIERAFARVIGIEDTEDLVDCWEYFHGALGYPVPFIAQTGRPRVGVRIHGESHYRSWQSAHAYMTMLGLVEAGFDCYVFGGVRHRVVFKSDGAEKRLWEDGIYDLCGMLQSPNEQMALIDAMDAVIAPDCGAILMSCALGKPTLGLFGPTRGAARAAYNPTLHTIDAEQNCAPCWTVDDHPPCEGRWCEAITGIDPERIVREVEHLVHERPAEVIGNLNPDEG